MARTNSKVGNCKGIAIQREDSLFAKPTKCKTSHVCTRKISINKIKYKATASEHSHEAKAVEDTPKDIQARFFQNTWNQLDKVQRRNFLEEK